MISTARTKRLTRLDAETKSSDAMEFEERLRARVVGQDVADAG
jgi:hypothetical protein